MFWFCVVVATLIVVVAISATMGDKIFDAFAKVTKKFKDDTPIEHSNIETEEEKEKTIEDNRES